MHFSQIEAIHKLNRPSVIKIKIIRGIIREEFFLFETKLNISLMMQLFFFFQNKLKASMQQDECM